MAGEATIFKRRISIYIYFILRLQQRPLSKESILQLLLRSVEMFWTTNEALLNLVSISRLVSQESQKVIHLLILRRRYDSNFQNFSAALVFCGVIQCVTCIMWSSDIKGDFFILTFQRYYFVLLLPAELCWRLNRKGWPAHHEGALLFFMQQAQQEQRAVTNLTIFIPNICPQHQWN